jgi:alpha-glucosidase
LTGSGVLSERPGHAARTARGRGGAPVDLASVHHDGSARYVVGVGGSSPDRPRIGDTFRIRVRTGLDAPVERVFLRTIPDGEQAFEEMREVGVRPACRWWEADLRVTMPTTGYRFLIVTASGQWWLNGTGLHRALPTDHDDFRLVAGFDPPPWLADRVFYQVFPDRFADGDPSIDVADGAWTYRGQPTRHAAWDHPPSSGPGALVEFYGGDLTGLEARLDHLADLGVNGIYLTPIFDARSNHGYDTIDYGHVAAHFGGDAALASLRRATRDRDIRLMLDIAPNHTGVEHPWFAAAQADLASPTAGYFVFHDHPDEYESWLGHRSLPKLDYRDGGLRDAMYAGPDGVLRHWLRPPFSIDAWRIDVANMLGRLGPHQLGGEVARGIRSAIKSENPEAYLIGEHAYDATEQLAGDQWDGVMNYAGFRTPVLDWLAGIEHFGFDASAGRPGRSTGEDLVESLAAYRAAVPWAVARCQYDLLDSHDTARMRTAVDGDPGRLRAAFGLLLTYVGVPSFLYGDELGLEGHDGLSTRRTMPWDTDWDLDHLAFVRALVRHRVDSPALTDGGFQVLEIGEDHVVFLRDTDDQQAIVVVVRGPASRPADPLAVAHGAVADGTTFEELLGGDRATVTAGRLEIGPTPPGVAIWTTRPAGRPAGR